MQGLQNLASEQVLLEGCDRHTRLVNLESFDELPVAGRGVQELVDGNAATRQSLADSLHNSIRSVESSRDTTLQTVEISLILLIVLTELLQDLMQTDGVVEIRTVAGLPDAVILKADTIDGVQNELQTAEATILAKG